MKQVAGRLMRDYDDYGVFMVGDSRLTTRGYGKVIMNALPPMRLCADGEVAADFLRQRRGADAAHRRACRTRRIKKRFSMLPPPLLIVDVSGYVFRAYHAPGVGDLRTRDGRPSGAIFGTMNMLVKLQRDFPTRQIVCVMDAPGKTFRHEIYPQYKANRPPAPPDLKVQFAPIREFLAATGWPLLSVSGVEADDVIATLTKREMRAERDVVVATADKDLMQLAGDGVLLYDGMKERRYDAAGVREKFGVTPHQIADYLALIGDSSDNIPGVAKVGPKTAVKWLISHQDLDSLIAAADSIAGVVGENLRDSIANGQLRLSRRLVELRDDMPANEVPENLTPQPPDKKTWRQLCEEWQFRRLSGAFDDAPATPAASPPSITAEKTAIEIITSETELSAWIDKIRAAKLFALAVETDGKPVMSASLVGLSLACGEQSAYLPLAHKKRGNAATADRNSVALAPPHIGRRRRQQDIARRQNRLACLRQPRHRFSRLVGRHKNRRLCARRRRRQHLVRISGDASETPHGEF